MRGRAEREWLELVADLMASPLTQLPVERLARQLNRTFDGAACAFHTPGERGARVVEWLAPVGGTVMVRRVHPLVPAQVAGRGGVVEAWNCRHRLGMPLSAHGHRGFVVGRDAEFTPCEVDLAVRIRRLIIGLDQQVRALAAGWAAETAEARITPREQAVLGELARGVTAVVISRRLGISERTVHKHLEHIYGKLDVTDRLSAVLRARDVGLIG